MGVVDLATAPDGSSVALKRLTLHGSAAEMARARQRIRREAEVLRRLDHPCIVRLLDVYDDDDGEVVLVMPYLPGGTLADRVAAHGPAPAHEVTRLAELLLGALAAAHRSGVVHRDIKPANVLFDRAGAPHLADFGVASARDLTDGLTATGTVVGTPAFMSPEQARGELVTRPADVFSLGATLLWAATGEGPWGTGDPAVLLQRAAQGKVRLLPREIPPDLAGLLGAMLHPRADRRPTAAALAGGPDGTIAVDALPRRRRRRRRWPAAAVVGAAAAGLLAVAAIAAVLGTDDGPRAAAADDPPASTVPACDPLPYQPCGEEPAPGTDGERCLDGFADYDGRPRNGCEAAADGHADGALLVDRLEANIVPEDDVDRFTVDVPDNAQLLCDGTVRFTLTAPAGTTLRLEVLDRDGEIVGETVSGDGLPSTVAIREPSCFVDDSTTLDLVVRPVGSDRSPEHYVLERDGSW
jgi:tRNA A-37 threonylcarbamoyl transferase component Bud32